MVMRELASGEAEACRQSSTTESKRQLTETEEKACEIKAQTKITQFLGGLNALSAEEKLVKIRGKFTEIWNITNSCVENFDPPKFVERNNEQKSVGELKAMITASITGGHMLKKLCEQMQSLVAENPDLASDHRASQEFMRCTMIAAEEENRLVVCKKVYTGDLPLPQHQPAQGLVMMLACKTMQFVFPAALTVADIIAV